MRIILSDIFFFFSKVVGGGGDLFVFNYLNNLLIINNFVEFDW